MTYTAYCKTKCFITDDNSIPYTKSYDFWKAMIQKISHEATEFEIRCWKNEALAIETGEKFGEYVNNFMRGTWKPTRRNRMLIFLG